MTMRIEVGEPAAAARDRQQYEAGLRRAAAGMEALFVQRLLGALRAGMPEGGVMGGKSPAGRMYEGMLDEQYAELAAGAGGLGLQDLLLRQWLPRGLRGVELSAPVEAPAGSAFGPRPDPLHRAGARHEGVDFAVPEGTPVRAAAGGVVRFAGARGDYGSLVVVDHGGGVETRYAHLSRLDTRAGARVRAGEPIGLAGASGRTTGPHLHFELRRDGEAVDPLPLLPQGGREQP
jgi:murein DD-endopeptidase MepM/ murein hydrolase activator NlpD